MATSSNREAVPEEVLLSFFSEATKALESCSISEPLSIGECRDVLLQQQTVCLEKVVQDHNDNANLNSITTQQLQGALTSLSETTFGGEQQSLQKKHSQALQTQMDAMTDAARLALARLVVTSICRRTGTTSLNDISDATTHSEPLKTSRMSRSDILEFCALCRASVRLESVANHLRDPQKPLLGDAVNNNNNDSDKSLFRVPPIKRLENLQRLLLQAMEYDADCGLTELARQLHKEGNDDVELVQTIQQTTAFLMETLLPGSTMLSDQDQGGVTRVVSVQHSQGIVQLVGGDGGPSATAASVAPKSQSMRGNDDDDDNGNNTNIDNVSTSQQQQQQQQFQMAQKAAALRESLANELKLMSDQERKELLQQAEQALVDFQRRAMEIPAGPERISFLTSMDAATQRLLALHRIWQEQQQQQQR